MARKKGFGLSHFLIGLLVLGGVGQCLKSPSSTPEAPRTAISSPSATPIPPPTLPAAVAPTEPQSVAAPLAATGRFYVTASTLNVRDAPSTSGRVLGKLSRGQQLAATGLQSDWLSMRLTDGRSAGSIRTMFPQHRRLCVWCPLHSPQHQLRSYLGRRARKSSG